MDPLYFEDYTPSLNFTTRSRTIREADLANFLGVSGMFESLFADASYETEYDGQLVPGALTYAISEGLISQEGILHGRGLAFVGLELRADAPVFVGDTVHVRVSTLEKRATRKRDRGIVITDHAVLNQRDEPVMTLRVTRMIKRRPD